MPRMRSLRFPQESGAPSVARMATGATSSQDSSREDDLGGRLPLLSPDVLSSDQRALHHHLLATRGASARGGSYRVSLTDGRLIGPFNAFLRAPEVYERQLDWVQAIAATGLSPAVRETVILTIGAEWSASYILYAHRQLALQAGVSAPAVDAICGGRAPEAADDVALAHRLTSALVRDHHVPNETYDRALQLWGEHGLAVLSALVGQYLATATVLTCFQVPAPHVPERS